MLRAVVYLDLISVYLGVDTCLIYGYVGEVNNDICRN